MTVTKEKLSQLDLFYTASYSSSLISLSTSSEPNLLFFLWCKNMRWFMHRCHLGKLYSSHFFPHVCLFVLKLFLMSFDTLPITYIKVYFSNLVLNLKIMTMQYKRTQKIPTLFPEGRKNLKNLRINNYILYFWNCRSYNVFSLV